MTIHQDIQSLAPSALLEFFELDMTAQGGSKLYFHAGTNELGSPVVWQGVTYQPMPIQAEGFDITARGQLPRPKLRVANIEGIISQILADNDIAGAKITRRRTFARYLDAVNFESGNPSADSSAEFPEDIFYIDRKTAENQAFVEFELSSSFDVTGVQLPRRQIIQNSCPWKYRSPECGYTGGAVADQLDSPTSVMSEDACGKRLDSCKLRFGETGVLPFGGFPAAGLVRA